MSWQTKAKALAKKLGAEVENNSNGEQYVYDILAPKGKIWSCNLIHCLVGNCFKGDPKWYEEVWKDLYERMSYGLEECDDPDCEWCHA